MKERVVPDIILPFLGGHSAFDPEATHAMSVAFEKACRILKLDDAHAREAVAARIIELARSGERDPERLCENALRGANKRRVAQADAPSGIALNLR
jgi:hypothetical protein